LSTERLETRNPKPKPQTRTQDLSGKVLIRPNYIHLGPNHPSATYYERIGIQNQSNVGAGERRTSSTRQSRAPYLRLIDMFKARRPQQKSMSLTYVQNYMSLKYVRGVGAGERRTSSTRRRARLSRALLLRRCPVSISPLFYFRLVRRFYFIFL